MQTTRTIEDIRGRIERMVKEVEESNSLTSYEKVLINSRLTLLKYDLSWIGCDA